MQAFSSGSECNKLPSHWNTANDMKTVFKQQQIVEINCDAGYTNSGSKIVTCLGNNEYDWSDASGVPACLKSNCE